MVHKKKIPLQRHFRCVEDIGVSLLRRVLKQDAPSFQEGDQICQHCFKRYKDMVSSYPDSGAAGDAFVPEEETVGEMNKFLEFSTISPLTLPSRITLNLH